MTDLTDAAPAMPPRPVAQAVSAGALFLLMALTALGQMATNLVVPSLRTIAAELELELSSAGLILSAVLIGIGVGQLVVGPLSDRWGRKPPLLAGLVLYVLASIGATLANEGSLLLLARFLQGFGASAGLALPRAIARDRYAGPTFLRVMSMLTLAMAVMPGLAPVLGGVVSQHFGWRAALALSAGAGLAALCAVMLALPESHRDRNSAGGLAVALGGYAHVLRRRAFLGYAIGSAAAIGGAYAEVTAVQALYQGGFGWTPVAVSFVASTYAAGFLAGGLLAPRLPLGHAGQIRIGLTLMLGSAALFLALAAGGLLTAPLAMALVVLSQVGVGFMMPPAIGLALMSVEGAAGTASAVMGALHMAVGAAGAALIGATAIPMAWALPAAMLGFAVLSAACLALVRPARGAG